MQEIKEIKPEEYVIIINGQSVRNPWDRELSIYYALEINVKQYNLRRYLGIIINKSHR